jgi:hypothetical protein
LLILSHLAIQNERVKNQNILMLFVATYLKSCTYRKSGDFFIFLILILRFLALDCFSKKPLNLRQKTTQFLQPKQKKVAGISQV